MLTTQPERSTDEKKSADGAETLCAVSVIVPTFNERENIVELLQRLESILGDRKWELIFVDDDSLDGTADLVLQIARVDRRVRLVRRIGRRGLSSAVIEGVLASIGDLIVVMDADLQHDETILPNMLALLEGEACDLVIASRYMAGGSVGGWEGKRQAYSSLATRLSRIVIKQAITDPMSGFFALKRDLFERSVRRLSGQGFKILLDILASAPKPVRVSEIPYVFRQRLHGESKLDTAALWEFGVLLLDKFAGQIIPARFLMFMLVGATGVGVHFAILSVALEFFGVDFTIAQTGAAIAAMTFNFFLNNTLTYRDRRLRGFWRLLRGLASFYAVCSLGLVANVGIAAFLFRASYSWWLAGIAGIMLGAVWNYAASSALTWKK